MKLLSAASKAAFSSGKGVRKYLYPAETSRHAATILGFPSKCSTPQNYENACGDIASLASAILAFEPVRLYMRPENIPESQPIVSQALTKYPSKASNISIIPFPTNHLWVRDTGPVYVHGTDQSDIPRRFAINFRFNEWGKRDKINDFLPSMKSENLQENASFAQRVIESDVSPYPVTSVESKVCLEGGALVVDGEGTLLATESSIINDNRNPGLSQATIEAELQHLLGVEKIIWFPGRKDLDITDVHADAEVNFVRPGVVVLSRPHPSAPQPWKEVYGEIRRILDHSVDAKGRRFEVHTVDEPDPGSLESPSDDLATNYVNFYFVNGGLIIPQFGDALRDREALETFQKLCPDRVIQPVRVVELASQGGVIHCSTQPVLSVEE